MKIQGQPSLFLLDLKGQEYPAIAEVNRKKTSKRTARNIVVFFYT